MKEIESKTIGDYEITIVEIAGKYFTVNILLTKTLNCYASITGKVLGKIGDTGFDTVEDLKQNSAIWNQK